MNLHLPAPVTCLNIFGMLCAVLKGPTILIIRKSGTYLVHNVGEATEFILKIHPLSVWKREISDHPPGNIALVSWMETK